MFVFVYPFMIIRRDAFSPLVNLTKKQYTGNEERTYFWINVNMDNSIYYFN
jgi:hypothetical protein